MTDLISKLVAQSESALEQHRAAMSDEERAAFDAKHDQFKLVAEKGVTTVDLLDASRTKKEESISLKAVFLEVREFRDEKRSMTKLKCAVLDPKAMVNDNVVEYSAEHEQEGTEPVLVDSVKNVVYLRITKPSDWQDRVAHWKTVDLTEKYKAVHPFSVLDFKLEKEEDKNVSKSLLPGDAIVVQGLSFAGYLPATNSKPSVVTQAAGTLDGHKMSAARYEPKVYMNMSGFSVTKHAKVRDLFNVLVANDVYSRFFDAPREMKETEPAKAFSSTVGTRVHFLRVLPVTLPGSHLQRVNAVSRFVPPVFLADKSPFVVDGKNDTKYNVVGLDIDVIQWNQRKGVGSPQDPQRVLIKSNLWPANLGLFFCSFSDNWNVVASQFFGKTRQGAAVSHHDHQPFVLAFAVDYGKTELNAANDNPNSAVDMVIEAKPLALLADFPSALMSSIGVPVSMEWLREYTSTSQFMTRPEALLKFDYMHLSESAGVYNVREYGGVLSRFFTGETFTHNGRQLSKYVARVLTAKAATARQRKVVQALRELELDGIAPGEALGEMLLQSDFVPSESSAEGRAIDVLRTLNAQSAVASDGDLLVPFIIDQEKFLGAERRYMEEQTKTAVGRLEAIRAQCGAEAPVPKRAHSDNGAPSPKRVKTEDEETL